MNIEEAKINVADKKYWVERIEGGCDYLWTDFGAPMCNAGLGRCFIGSPSIMVCPIGKKELSNEN